MRKKAITKIKIQDILDKAEVSRGTFHNHFEDKYDLIRYCYDVKVLPQWDYKQEEDMDAAERIAMELLAQSYTTGTTSPAILN